MTVPAAGGRRERSPLPTTSGAVVRANEEELKLVVPRATAIGWAVSIALLNVDYFAAWISRLSAALRSSYSAVEISPAA